MYGPYKSHSARDYFTDSKFFLTAEGQWPYQSQVSSRVFQYLWILQHVSIMVPEVFIIICMCMYPLI